MPATTPDASPEAGFTLIETLVALVIVAASLLVFYEFLASALHGATAAERAATAYDRRQSALALASTLNPMETPEGEFDLLVYRIHWRAERLGAVRQSSGFAADQGRFAIALYRVVLDFPGQPEVPPVAVTKLGYHRERPPDQAAVGEAQ